MSLKLYFPGLILNATIDFCPHILYIYCEPFLKTNALYNPYTSLRYALGFPFTETSCDLLTWSFTVYPFFPLTERHASDMYWSCINHV